MKNDPPAFLSKKPTQWINLDTPRIRELRDHLIDLSVQSIRPLHGGTKTSSASPEERAVLERFRPFAELFYLVAWSDGEVDSEERAVMMGAFRALTSGRVSTATLEELEATLAERCRGCSLEERLESICSELSADREDAELAFTLASAVALANQNIAREERAFLKQLATWLHLSPERIAQLFESGYQSIPPPAVHSPSGES